MSHLYIGLMSGTSLDGIDAVLVDFSQTKPHIIATHYLPFTQSLRTQIQALCQPGDNEIQRLGDMDITLGKTFAQAVNQLLAKQSIAPNTIKAIGSHGQTIRHAPHSPQSFTLQIGDPNTITAITGITTVADFRRKDIAYGGQGAPLVPAFHQAMWASTTTNRAVVNIGGIANVTLLTSNATHPVLGFDTGPGNTLLDAWINQHQQCTHDKDGAWGATGSVHHALLNRLLADKYFHLSPPKSTGREYFNLHWLQSHLQAPATTITAVDVQATLVELTAHSIVNAISDHIPDGEILLCGGGTHNAHLLQSLRALSPSTFTIETTQKYGIDPDWVEAIAFAWLAKQTLERQPGNLPSVTGAAQAAVLGGVYYS